MIQDASDNSRILLVHKPKDVTSFRSLGMIKKTLGTKKVGHTGTLDRFAEGLMVVLSGRLTRLAPVFSNLDKEYIAVFRFGVETDTLDPEGNEIKHADVPEKNLIESSLSEFIGTYDQIPPAYSAKSIDGVRAYQRARRGESVQMKPVSIRIHDAQVLKFELPDVTLRISCSKGTYIRSLARDVAARCGSCAYVTELSRTRVGPFRLDDAVSADKVAGKGGSIETCAAFEAMGLQRVQTADARAGLLISYGRDLADSFFVVPPKKNGIFGIFDEKKHLQAVAEKTGDVYTYRLVINND
jgi:tRNA pseudouridine55 synthase